MKFQKLWDDALDTYVYTPIVENEFFDDNGDYVENVEDDMRFHRPHPRNPLVDGWICPYCGKRVYSMEVHPCNQPYCKADRGEWL